MLFDSHAHPHFNAFREDSDAVIRRSLAANVEMLLVGTQADTSVKTVETAKRYDGAWAAIGLHPVHTTEGYFDPAEETGAPVGGGFRRRAEIFDAEMYRRLARSSPKVVAIGEVGLDYYRLEGTEAEREAVKRTQQDVFRQQILLAVDLNLPLSIHCRDAYDDVYRMLKEAQARYAKVRGVIHCFTGAEEEAERLMSLGFYISFSGIITFAQSWDSFIRKTPLEKLLVETDCPYLTPVPHRGKRNEPAYVAYTAAHLAKIKGLSFDEVARTTTANAKHLFGIGKG
ncbi:MAG: TatD family hydrolase [Patescibacteria group bacterium]|jgi:TatD DNase family protein